MNKVEKKSADLYSPKMSTRDTKWAHGRNQLAMCEALAAVESGCTNYAQLERDLGVPRRTLNRYLDAHHHRTPGKSRYEPEVAALGCRRKTKWTSGHGLDTLRRALAEAQRGCTTVEIQRALGVPPRTLRRYMSLNKRAGGPLCALTCEQAREGDTADELENGASRDAECEAAECEAAECEAAECEAAKYQAAKYQAAKYQAAECEVAKYQAAECEAAKYQAAECEAAASEAAYPFELEMEHAAKRVNMGGQNADVPTGDIDRVTGVKVGRDEPSEGAVRRKGATNGTAWHTITWGEFCLGDFHNVGSGADDGADTGDDEDIGDFVAVTSQGCRWTNGFDALPADMSSLMDTVNM